MIKYLIILSIIFLAANCPNCPTHDPTECDTTIIRDSVAIRDSINIITQINWINDTNWKDSTIFNYRDSITFINCPEDSIPEADKPFFESDFEDVSLRVKSDNSVELLGATWQNLVNTPEVHGYSIVTEGYNLSLAYPEIITKDSKVMHYKIISGNGTKARVQGVMSFDVDTLKEYRSQYKIWIPSVFKKLETYNQTKYIKFAEIWDEHEDAWDGNAAGQAYWRFGLRTNPLCWFFDGYYEQPAYVRDQILFPRITSNVSIPYDKWAVLDYTFHPGNNGWVKITITYDGQTYTLFDAEGNTAYPEHNLPVGWYQPMKLYLESDVVSYLGGCELYFDDFKLWLK